MTRINIAVPRDSVATNIWSNLNALAFAAVLIVCSFAVGCSSEKPQPVSSTKQIPATQAPIPIAPTAAPTIEADNKPAPKKVVHKKPATVNYSDKTYGVTFEYPRRYAIETGDAAADLLMSSPMPMNFVQPGGVALAAVELPETNFANTDFSSAFFNVSVHKGLTADQCNQFAVPQPRVAAATIAKSDQTAPAASKPETPRSAEPSAAAPEAQAATTQVASVPAEAAPAAQSQPEPQGSRLLVGDLELRASEAVSGEGTRQSDAKYFHVFHNGACYEFALNVTTVASQSGLIKHVDRDKVFDRLERILDTVKIEEVKPAAAAPEVSAEAPAPTSVPEAPAP